MAHSFFYKRGQKDSLRDLGLFAPGIPEKKIEPLPEVKEPQSWQLSVQQHDAERAGTHYDLRLVDPKTHKAHSWALPAARLPEPGKSNLALQQPTHTEEYALHFGERKPQDIPSGYGKGKVKIKQKEPVEVFHSRPGNEGTKVRFNIYRSTGPEEYAIVPTKQGDRLVNKTLTKERMPALPIGKKPKSKDTDIKQIDTSKTDEAIMPKYDGAHTLLYLKDPNRIPRVFSYRQPKRHKAGVIEHTQKMPALLKKRIPPEHKDTIIRAETIAVDKDSKKAIPAREVGGMLNATVPTSRENQKSRRAFLTPMMFDVERYRGKDMTSKPYKERYQLLRQISKDLDIPVTELAVSDRKKRKLIQDVKAGRHPLSQEGVMLRNLNSPDTSLTKAKLRPDHDVYIREIFEATDAQGNPKGRAGGFKYSWRPRGPIIGSVGTGFNHNMAEDMLKNPQKYKDRVAKVEAESVFPSGKLSKPAFKELHLDKGKID